MHPLDYFFFLPGNVCFSLRCVCKVGGFKRRKCAFYSVYSDLGTNKCARRINSEKSVCITNEYLVFG